MIPVASFTYLVNGLGVTFTDTSGGNPNQWLWDFGHVGGYPPQPVTSPLQNPTINFPVNGIYRVKLTVSNAEGSSDFELSISLNADVPTLSLTIEEMVRCNLPIQLSVDTVCFKNSIQKWQLYLQPYMNPSIPDGYVFDQSKWNPIANVLISKLIIYDLILNAAELAMASYYAMIKNQEGQLITNTMEVADYSVILPNLDVPLLINSITIDGNAIGPSPSFNDTIGLMSWLNALGYGQFLLNSTTGELSTLGNSHLFTQLQITTNSGGYLLTFNRTNERVVPISQIYESGGSVGGTNAMGPIKKIETGPSNTEWYDASSFWSTMFKSYNPGNIKGGTGGIFENIVSDICIWGARLGVYLPMCPKRNTANKPIFLISKAPNTCGCGTYQPRIPSKGIG